MKKMKRGVYENSFGNTTVYLGGEVGYDIDGGTLVPLSEINFDKFIREVEPEDESLCDGITEWF